LGHKMDGFKYRKKKYIVKLFLWERLVGNVIAHGRRKGKGMFCVAERVSLIVGVGMVKANK